VEKKVPIDWLGALTGKKIESNPSQKSRRKTQNVEKRASYKAERKSQPIKEENKKVNIMLEKMKLKKIPKKKKKMLLSKFNGLQEKKWRNKEKISNKIPKVNKKYSEIVE